MNNRVNYAGFLDLIIETVKETEPDLHDTIPSTPEYSHYSRSDITSNQVITQES
jgi:hypothetical protein